MAEPRRNREAHIALRGATLNAELVSAAALRELARGAEHDPGNHGKLDRPRDGDAIQSSLMLLTLIVCFAHGTDLREEVGSQCALSGCVPAVRWWKPRLNEGWNLIAPRAPRHPDRNHSSLPGDLSG